MGRILAIDYGQKRVGIAVTDELRLIANSLDTVHVKDIWDYLKNYLEKENVDEWASTFSAIFDEGVIG